MNSMAKKLRVINLDVYANHNEIKSLEGVDLEGFENAIKATVSKRGNGKDATAIIRIIPVFAPVNTIDIELFTYNEGTCLITETDITSIVHGIIDEYFDMDFAHIHFKQFDGASAIISNEE